MLEQLKTEVLKANKRLQTENLVVLTWGNVSGRDPETGLIVIKASGVRYDIMTEDDLVVVDPEGNVVEGKLHPSTDLPTHLVLYRNFKNIHGIVHTHSTFAAVWAQIGAGIPCYGTTHADYFPGVIPVTRELTPDEVKADYEKSTGEVIVETFRDIDPEVMRAVLVKGHGPFVWGSSASDALHNAIVLENVAKMDLFTKMAADSGTKELGSAQLKKHYDRKFGEDAYYGQE
ncbi:L-ribulose-5-phosphate 4-epimerase AraD [Clostridium sp. Marseille-P3244]|uniref:L-ribulose-5-phosphate 4-epimerase AraD n=1 Tax=Clostridium sp. Marseille-P3244 TaxID=1871020 RepID=UPI000931DC60|nr:L-ribulose-5-phosphate 4-epimerase AraD [Clostridium sp. Marseille-P3244]